MMAKFNNQLTSSLKHNLLSQARVSQLHTLVVVSVVPGNEGGWSQILFVQRLKGVSDLLKVPQEQNGEP